MATIMEMAADIIAAHASTTPMSKDELLAELNEVHSTLSALEKGETLEAPAQEAEDVPPSAEKKLLAKIKFTA